MGRYLLTLLEIDFPGFTFELVDLGGDRWALRVVTSEGVDNVTGKGIAWKGRKWLLSPHMTDGEIVQTAFKAILTALEHEAREQFTYKGVSVFDPHFDIDKLVELRMSPDGGLKERSHG